MFGKNITAMDQKSLEMDADILFCNSFQEKIMNDQICYEVDLETFKSNEDIENDLKLGLSFVMDYNEDRQAILEESATSPETESWKHFRDDGFSENGNALIYLNTIGKIQYAIKSHFSCTYVLEPVKLVGEGEYNLNVIKEIKVTESCHGLGRHVTECQNEEDIEDCTTRQYIDSYIKQCGCIPISIFRATKNVYPLN